MFRGTHVSPARALSENRQRGITPKILMPELWILCMILDPLKLYQHMKFHFNSISWTRVICKTKSVTGKVWRTYGRTDGRMDGRTDGWTDRQTDRQTTEKWSLSVTSAYSRWHKNCEPVYCLFVLGFNSFYSNIWSPLDMGLQCLKDSSVYHNPFQQEYWSISILYSCK